MAFRGRKSPLSGEIQPGSALMGKMLIAVLVAGFGLAGAATAGLLSATRPVIAILANDLFVGEAEGHLNGAGTLAIHSQKNPGLTCLGQFTSSAELGGSGQLRCSDGATAKFHFQRLSVYRGHGAGEFTRGSMSFSYGLTAEEAAPYLKLPRGKRLAYNGTELELVDVQEGRTQAQLTEFNSEGRTKSRADRNWQDGVKTAVIEQQ